VESLGLFGENTQLPEFCGFGNRVVRATYPARPFSVLIGPDASKRALPKHSIETRPNSCTALAWLIPSRIR
jgi:hypothetical protein